MNKIKGLCSIDSKMQNNPLFAISSTEKTQQSLTELFGKSFVKNLNTNSGNS